MPKKTTEEIATEIEALRQLRSKVPHFSTFGDDNRVAIEAQIASLCESLDEDTAVEVYEENAHTLDKVLSALTWRDGQASDGSPSESWAAICR